MRPPAFFASAMLACVTLALAGCSSTSEGAGGSALNSAALGASAASVDQSTPEFFEVSVGDRVFFRTDETTLTPESRMVLERQARWLQLNPSVRITIEGHADERGTREYNIALGANRAESVKVYLVSRGVSADRIRTVSWGRERPVAVCSQERCWSQNRRAVTVVE